MNLSKSIKMTQSINEENIENKMQIFSVLDSTQIEAKRQIDIENIVIETAILSRTQTNGITTKPNVRWETSKDNLSVSIILHIDTLLKNGNILLNQLPFCASLAILDTIAEIDNSLQVLLKWPNDVLIKSISTKNNFEYKKICGILCEIYKGHFIIGIGCNLVSHPNKTKHFLATDILSETGKKVELIEFAKSILQRTKYNILNLQRYGFNCIKDKWKKHAFMLNEILILRDNKEVLFKDITDDGHILALREDDGETTIISSDEVVGGRSIH